MHMFKRQKWAMGPGEVRLQHAHIPQGNPRLQPHGQGPRTFSATTLSRLARMPRWNAAARSGCLKPAWASARAAVG